MLRALHSVAKEGMGVASMGYPDVISHPKELEAILGAKVYRLKYREDSKSIATWHGAEWQIPTAESFFALLGLKLDVYDIVEHRGGEILRDLNDPLPESDLGRYDIVLDVGSLEHCFQIGQAAFNMAGLLKEGGVIIHENPFLAGNHGFYSLNPTFYADFYLQNGFAIESCELVAWGGKRDGVYVPMTHRFKLDTSEELSCFVMAKRVKVQPLRTPLQTKYAKMIRKLTPHDAVGA